MRFGWDTPWVSRKVVLEAHDIPRDGSGDLLKNRFRHVIDFLELYDGAKHSPPGRKGAPDWPRGGILHFVSLNPPSSLNISP